MKKILLVSILLVCFIFVSGCKAGKDSSAVETLTFKSVIAEADDSQEERVEIVLKPDYDLRTLAVSYSTTEKTEEGVIGGDFFERFSAVVSLIEEDELVSLEGDDEAAKGAITVVLKYDDDDDENYTRMFSYYGGDETQGIEQLADYYADLKTLFTQDVY